MLSAPEFISVKSATEIILFQKEFSLIKPSVLFNKKMKNLILPLLLFFVVQVSGQSTMNIHKTDGTVVQIPITEIDSVTYTIVPGSG